MLDHLERIENYEAGLGSGDALDPRAADAYLGSVIHLAGRMPASAVHEFGLLEMLSRASDVAQLLGRGQAVGELAQLHAFRLESEALWDQARDVRLAALASGLKLGISAPMLLIGQSQAEENLGSLGQSLVYAAQAEEALFLDLSPRTPGFTSAHSQILGVKGELYVVLGLLDRAQTQIEASLELAEGLGDPKLLVAANTRLAMLFGAAQQASALKRLIQRCLADERIREDERLRVALYLRLGICLASGGNPEETGEEALRLAAASELLGPLERFRAQTWLANLALRRGALEEAEAWLQRAEESIEVHQSARPPSREVAFLQALYSKLAMASDASQAELEQVHGRLQAAFDGFLANWQSTPVLRGGVAFLRYSSRNLILNELLRLKLRLQPGPAGIEAALHELHRAQAQGSLARKAKYQVASLEALRRELLGEREGLLLFLPGAEGCHWFALDHESLSHERLPSIHSLRKDQANLVARVTKQPEPAGPRQVEPELQAALVRMSQELLPEAIRRKLASWSAVTVIGLDTLGYVPLEHLPLAEDKLVDDQLAVSYLPSLPLGMLLKARPDPLQDKAGLDLYFHGPPGERSAKDAAGGPALDGARNASSQLPAEILLDEPQWSRLIADFEPERVRHDRGPRATHASLRSSAAQEARVSHLLTHGLPGKGLIRTVDLQLTRDAADREGRLTCEQADELELGSLVVISACNAGQGPLRQGEDGGVGFGGAFLQGARTRAVVLSPAKLDLLAQYRLIPLFYGQLTRGESPAESLRRARRALRRDPAFSHPYYSLMHVLGLGNEPIFEPGR